LRAGAPRRGLLAEVVASLALVMCAATLVVVLLLFHAGEARQRDLLGRALLAESRASNAPGTQVLPGTVWWRVGPDGTARATGGSATEIDAASAALAAAARERRASLLQPGAPWEPLRFAAPAPDGAVLVARAPASLPMRAAPLALVALLLAIDVALFTWFGATLLRRRVVAPLEQLAIATRELAAGGFAARLAPSGPRETVEVAEAWNAMSEALARRTAALEKAVAELRDANADLRVARTGLERAQRLAAVGRLAAGVAHEVGNPLAAMLAFVDLAGRDPGLRDDSRSHLERAGAQGDRVRRILRQLLEFSRPPRMERMPVDLAALAEEAVALVAAQRRYAELRFEVAAVGSPPRALGDPAGVAQILLNLVVNAADAVLAEGGTGAVRVQVRGAALGTRAGDVRDPGAARRHPDAVECEVADQGAGVAPEDRERLFDPFFTTKAPGEGTGLGLANSLRLAEELQGALELVEAPEGFRTAFVLRLAAADSASDCAPRTGVRA
jgi:signal transduction histidine kinase